MRYESECFCTADERVLDECYIILILVLSFYELGTLMEEAGMGIWVGVFEPWIMGEKVWQNIGVDFVIGWENTLG
jgi:hypothetical protein